MALTSEAIKEAERLLQAGRKTDAIKYLETH